MKLVSDLGPTGWPAANRLGPLGWLALFALAATLSYALAVPPAHAAQSGGEFHCTSTCRFTDRSGDAPARADILSARFSNGSKAFGLRLRVRNLKRTGSFVLGAGLGGWGVNYRVVKRKHGYRVTGQTISEVTIYPAVRCASARVTWNAKKNFIRATFPHSCTGDSGGSIVNGLDFHSRGASDRIGKVFYTTS